MAKNLTYDATLIERTDLTSALAIFKVKPDDAYTESGPWFIPGQYVTLGLNNEESSALGSVRRPMSIASAPEEREFLEFYIRYVSHPESDNPLTHLLWQSRTGDRLFMRPKPVGRFTLSHTAGEGDKRKKILVAAGTGLAPFVSMVRSEQRLDPAADLSRYVILHGASYPEDLGYREELETLARDHGLFYFSSISRPGEATQWSGDVGRVEDYFLPDRRTQLEERLGLAPEGLCPDQVAILICGLQGTIGSTITRMADRGFVPENRKLRRALEVPEKVESSLFFEQYDSTPVVDITNPEELDPLREQLHAALADPD